MIKMATAGTSRNMIPPNAQAMADVRVTRVADYDGIEKKVAERVKKQLVPALAGTAGDRGHLRG